MLSLPSDTQRPALRHASARYRAAAISQERAAKQRLVHLRREISMERVALAQMNLEEEKMALADEVRWERAQMFNHGMREALANAPRATEAEVVRLAEVFTAALCKEVIPIDRRTVAKGCMTLPETPSWFKLFKEVDADGSGQITYGEFSHMARHRLGLSQARLPEDELQRVWLSLDSDCSGLVTSGEFGAFMRMGEGCPEARQRRVFQPTTRNDADRTHARRRDAAQRARQELEEENLRHAQTMLLSPDHAITQSTRHSDERVQTLERELAVLREMRATHPHSPRPASASARRADSARFGDDALRSWAQMSSVSSALGSSSTSSRSGSSWGPPPSPGRRPLPKPETPRRTCSMSAKAGAANFF